MHRIRLSYGRPFIEAGYGEWVPFDSDEYFDNLMEKEGSCRPCMEGIGEQLHKHEGEIQLGGAYGCWKVVGVTDSNIRSFAVMEEMEARIPEGMRIFGKFGGKGEGYKTSAIIIYSTENTAPFMDLLGGCMERVYPAGEIKLSRGCQDVHGELFGDWKDWKPSMAVKHPEKIRKVMETIMGKL